MSRDLSPSRAPAWAFAMPPPRLRQLALAGLVLAAVAALVLALRPALSEVVALLVLLSAVLVNAAGFGFWAGMGSALAALVMFNLLFVEPHFSLTAAKPQDVVVLLAFFGAAALTGLLAGRLREEVNAARDRADVLEVLSAATGDLAAAGEARAILTASLTHIAKLSAGAAVWIGREPPAPEMPGPTATGAGLVVLGMAGGEMQCSAADMQAAEQALSRGTAQFATAAGWSGSHLSFRPLPSGASAVYVLGHRVAPVQGPGLGYRDTAIDTVLAQAEAALARLDLSHRAEVERQQRERQSLRAALLSSLSHDLRTPLATILGALTTLRDLSDSLPPEAQKDLLEVAAEDATRLARYVEKLLHMTRLTAGATVALHPVDPAEMALAAVERAARAFPDHVISCDLGELPLVAGEAGLIEQVMFNLIENAIRHAPGPIMLRGAAEGGELRLAVVDQGPGLPARLAEWLASPSVAASFPEAFPVAVSPMAGGGPGDLNAAPEASLGTGLGLPICKGIAHLLGGRLEATKNTPHGAVVALILPSLTAVAGEAVVDSLAALPTATPAEPKLDIGAASAAKFGPPHAPPAADLHD